MKMNGPLIVLQSSAPSEREGGRGGGDRDRDRDRGERERVLRNEREKGTPYCTPLRLISPCFAFCTLMRQLANIAPYCALTGGRQ